MNKKDNKKSKDNNKKDYSKKNFKDKNKWKWNKKDKNNKKNYKDKHCKSKLKSNKHLDLLKRKGGKKSKKQLNLLQL